MTANEKKKGGGGTPTPHSPTSPLKTHLCLGFCHGEPILRRWPPTYPAFMAQNTQPKRRLIPADAPRTATACWGWLAGSQSEFVPRTRWFSADSATRTDHAFTLSTRITHRAGSPGAPVRAAARKATKITIRDNDRVP